MQLHLQGAKRQLSDFEERLPRASQMLLRKRLDECAFLDEKLRLLSPENILKRGYSITLKDGRAVTQASALQPGDQLVTRFYEGEVVSTVES